jgi:hypothetical protein
MMLSAASLCLFLPKPGTCAIVTGSSYFPTTVGSTWSYNTQAWTQSGTQQGLKSGTETVEVLSDGSFKSIINLVNGNKTTSYNFYVNQGQAINVSNTQITILTVDTGMPGFSTETTSVNTYSPSQLLFPSSTALGTHETSSSAGTTSITGVSHTPFGDQPMPPVNNPTQQVVDITVGAPESVTVPAGTFTAIKVVETITATDSSGTNTLTINEWFAPGVGLVKMDSPVMKRDLTGYTVSGGTTPKLTMTLLGNGGGAVNSNPSGFTCTSGTCTQAYPAGASIVLSATPDSDSLFTAWGGDCSGTGDCTLTTSVDHSATATFTGVSPVRIGTTDYPTLQAAFSAVTGDTTVHARSRTFVEDLTLSQPWQVTLEGGYAINYASRTGASILQGRLTVAGGTLVADLVQVR